MSRDPGAPPRCLLVQAVATLALALLVGWLLPDLIASATAASAPRRFDAWLVLGCAAATLVAATWLWVLVVLVAHEARRGSGPTRVVPRVVRRLVLAACGVGLVGSLGPPVHADPSRSPLAGLPLPDRPTASATRPTGERPEATSATVIRDGGHRARTVRVVRGDSLWALAVDGLPEGASLADVDQRWRAIHAANRAVIGDDPDLILPGQQLRLPPSPPAS
jgi:hypothetical protein